MASHRELSSRAHWIFLALGVGYGPTRRRRLGVKSEPASVNDSIILLPARPCIPAAIIQPHFTLHVRGGFLFTTMNARKQVIAIAEACGYTKIKPYIRIRTHDRIHIIKGDRPTNGRGRLPGYLNDLNAMHEAEKVLHPERPHSNPWVSYRLNCLKIAGDCSLHATAAQRAEAFLRTLGKWEEST